MTSDTPKTYKTLEALVGENLETIKEKKLRPYKVTPQEGETVYALAKSKGKAALTLCEVETCQEKEIKDAFLNWGIQTKKAQEKTNDV